MNILKEDISQVWNIDRFKMVRFPELLWMLGDLFFDSVKLPNVLDMPIKLPQGDFVLPDLGHSAGVILRALLLVIRQKEEERNPNWNNYYCYLTTNQGYVKAGQSQRNGGAHFDGMQGFRYKDKFPVCHQYLISSCNPTVYYPHGFNFDVLDDNKHNFFLECDRQKQLDKAFIAKPNCLYLQTAYCVHESPAAKEDCFRSFVRVEFSLKQFNRIGNSENPNLKTGWNYEAQPIPEHLI